MRSTELAEKAGITFRQLDWWVRTGRVTCEQRETSEPRHDWRGTGYPRQFTDAEAAVVIDAGALVAAGLKLDAALTLARAIATHGIARLGPYTVHTDQPRERSHA